MNAFGYEPTPQENTGFDLLLPEEVPALIEVAEMRDTKANDGSQYLYAEAMITDGDQAGRKAVLRFNLINNNPQAVEIARREFDGLIYGLGFGDGRSPSEPEDLIGKSMLLCIKQKPRKNGQGNENVFKFKRLETHAPAASGGGFKASAAKSAASGGSAPWKRNAA